MVLSRVVRRIVLAAATIAQIVIGAYIVHFALKLQDIEYSEEDNTVKEVSCALDHNSNDPENENDSSLCMLAFAGVSITFALMLGLSIILHAASPRWILYCSVAHVNSVALGGYSRYASWVYNSVRKIDDWDRVPEWNDDEIQNARSNVVALAWGEAALTALVAATILSSSCCCSGGDDK